MNGIECALRSLCIGSLLLAWTMVYAEAKEWHILTYLSKTLASVCFVTAGFLCAMTAEGDRIFNMLLLAGLVLGMLGDIFLCRKQVVKEEYYAPLLTAGGGFFLSGHLCYFGAFLFITEKPHYPVYLGVPVLMLLVFFLMKSDRWRIEKEDWISYLGYALVSGLMLSGAISLVLEKPEHEQILLVIAAFTFLVSDLTLATWNYGKLHTRWMRYLCISLYYLAQIMFVFGIK